MVLAAAAPSAGAVKIAIEAGPSADSASSIGRTAARAVAATMIEMRSLAMSAGRPQPNTASAAVHGVRRSTWARTMPSRNSTARRGSSSGRNRKRDGRRTISTRLPLIAFAAPGGSAPNVPPSAGASRSRRPPLSAPLSVKERPSLSSTMRTTRGETNRPNAATMVAATPSSQRETNSPMSRSSVICTSIRPSSAHGRDLIEIVAPRQYTIGFVRVICEQDDDLCGRSHSAVELNADRQPECPARLDGGAVLHSPKQREQRLSVEVWLLALRQHGIHLLGTEAQCGEHERRG